MTSRTARSRRRTSRTARFCAWTSREASCPPKGDTGLQGQPGADGAPGPGRETSANDAVDNDGDGFVDCTDIDVAGLPACAPSAYELPCGDGLDNDKYIDLRDPECFALSFGGPPGGTGEANANDGVDNDPDTWALMACSLDPRESGGQCTDGVDNDNDGYIDAVDPNCRP